VNADAFQVYQGKLPLNTYDITVSFSWKGLDIATAKVEASEVIYNAKTSLVDKYKQMKGVQHHMLGVYDATSCINVRIFQDDALKIIDDIHGNGRLPVIVGGTNYYIESLIFDQKNEASSTKGDNEGHH
jgi:tRNA dimethylallyltransferase